MTTVRSEGRSEAKAAPTPTVRSEGVCQVQVSDEVYQVCLAHALMTEHEEVMGLLLGDAVGANIRIWASLTLQRSDKRADRVEISPEQLVEAAEMAERITKEVGLHTRVVGWYHSHPHITCLPSHVDLRTQLQYQSMDSLFIGLIFAVFNADPRAGRMCHELMAFRADGASGGPARRVELQPCVVPLSALLSEEQETLAATAASTSLTRCWGHRAMSTPAEQSFAEICDRHRDELLQANGEGDALAWADFCARHLQQLNAVLYGEVVPLRQHFDDAVHNVEVLASVSRGHSDWVRKQPPGMLTIPEGPPAALTSAATPCDQVPVPVGGSRVAGAGESTVPGGLDVRGGNSCARACGCAPAGLASGSRLCSFSCRPTAVAVAVPEGTAEPRPHPDSSGSRPGPATSVPEQTSEPRPELSPDQSLSSSTEEEEEAAVQHSGEEQAEAPVQQPPPLGLASSSASAAAGGSERREGAASQAHMVAQAEAQPEANHRTVVVLGQADVQVTPSRKCSAMTGDGTRCRNGCLQGSDICHIHLKSQKRQRLQSGKPAGQRDSRKRLRTVQEGQGVGKIDFDQDKGIYIARPCHDTDRLDGPHPDACDGQAPVREFSEKQFGDAADSKAQQYLMGCKYADLVGKIGVGTGQTSQARS
uniref:MPN domain-containing protein n=1 Tax=Alexandrium monilatum TaxID=311494 RepID=A0A7S4W2N6_9DINO|mmetsp:Transcript_92927/g.277322  ORF Transcript_92927/g.277322 Transcript_92927/m.277322 type:complete len:648 (-) Transcript_92927:191-2134(-)